MAKVNRRKSRQVALQSLFAFLSRDGRVSEENCFLFVKKELEGYNEEDEFAKILLRTTIENLGKLKVVTKAYASDFSYEKIAPINRALILQGLCEMKFFETPPVVVINEYVEMAKTYGEESSAKFVNGVLDEFRKNLGKDR